MISFLQSFTLSPLSRESPAKYFVQDISSHHAADINICIDNDTESVTYRSKKPSANSVSSNLGIVCGSKFDYDGRWSSYFGAFQKSTSSKFVVLVQQSRILFNQPAKQAAFILAECHTKDVAKECLLKLEETLHPLLNSNTILFSQKLLEALILPFPVAPEDLTSHLIELMEHKPEAFTHWYRIAQVINPPITEISQDFKNDDKNDTNCIRQMLPTCIPAACSNTIVNNHHNKNKRKSMKIDLHIMETLTDENEEFFTPCAPFSSSKFLFHETTPLITSVSQGYIKSSLYLLLGGSNPNFTLPLSGDTALHLAADQGNALLVKLLITFEADPRIINKKGETALQRALAAKANECATILREVTHLLDKAEDIQDESFEKRSMSSSDLTLLSLDGGGARAIMEIQILIAIEKEMKKLNPSCSSIMNYFDYVAGTSGGAYIMFITVYGKADLKASRSMVFSALSTISNASNSKSRLELLENFLKEVLGHDGVMSDVKSPRIIATGTLADTSPCRLHLMTNYGPPRDGQLGPHDRKQWEAARITSAVPVCFKSYQGKFLDGGVMANNPTLDAITEIHNQSMIESTNDKLKFVLSLGSGVSKAKPISNIDINIPTRSLHSLMEIPQSLQGLKNLTDIFLHQLTQSDGQEVERCKAWCHQIGAQYHRLSATVNENIPLDETDVNKMILTMYDAQMYVLREAKTIKDIAYCLISKVT
jgi:patatin-like phospholipase/acyl hydrolase